MMMEEIILKLFDPDSVSHDLNNCSSSIQALALIFMKRCVSLCVFLCFCWTGLKETAGKNSDSVFKVTGSAHKVPFSFQSNFPSYLSQILAERRISPSLPFSVTQRAAAPTRGEKSHYLTEW